MRKLVYAITIVLSLASSPRLKADMWGADIPILLDILANNITQLYQLYELVNRSQETLYLMQDIHDGINDTLSVVQALENIPGSGLYGDWGSVRQALTSLQTIYGSVPRSINQKIHKQTDQNIAEAINMKNALFKYADDLDEVGSSIQSRSQSSSPKGAAKLTAQSLGILVQVMNQSLRAQATGLKLQAQSLALANKKEKDETKKLVKTNAVLSSGMKSHRSNFKTPSF